MKFQSVPVRCPACGRELHVPVAVEALPCTSDDVAFNQVTVQVRMNPGPNVLVDHECVS